MRIRSTRPAWRPCVWARSTLVLGGLSHGREGAAWFCVSSRSGRRAPSPAQSSR
jgi:hypothetical protein